MRKSQSGFSLVELMLAISIATVLSTVLLAISLGFVADVFRSRATAELAVESHFVLQTMIEDVRLADGIAASNIIADANAPTGGWTTNDSLNRIVINSPAIDSARNIIYDPNTGYPYSNHLIYYKDGTNLFRRSLKETTAVGNTTITSCPEAIASSSCPADKKYSSNLEDLTFTFYDINNVVTTDPALARSLKVGVVLSRQSFGKIITLNNSVQTTLRNY